MLPATKTSSSVELSTQADLVERSLPQESVGEEVLSQEDLQIRNLAELKKELEVLGQNFRASLEKQIFDACLINLKHLVKMSHIKIESLLDSSLRFLLQLPNRLRITFKKATDYTENCCYYNYHAPYDVIVYIPPDLTALNQSPQFIRQYLFDQIAEIIANVTTRIISEFDKEQIAKIHASCQKYFQKRFAAVHNGLLLTLPDQGEDLEYYRKMEVPTPRLLKQIAEIPYSEFDRNAYIPDGFTLETINKEKIRQHCESCLLPELRKIEGFREGKGKGEFNLEATLLLLEKELKEKVKLIIHFTGKNFTDGDTNPFLRSMDCNNQYFAKLINLTGDEIIHDFLMKNLVADLYSTLIMEIRAKAHKKLK